MISGAGRLALAAALGVALAACSVGRANLAQEARTQMVGMSRDALVACAGPPDRMVSDDNQELFIYETGTPDYDAMVGRDPGPVQQVTGTGSPRYCEATIMLRDGRVRSVSYRGDTGGLMTQGEACASIVEGCVSGGS